MPITLCRFDLEPFEKNRDKEIKIDSHSPVLKNDFILKYSLPPDSIIKIRTTESRLIPWSYLHKCTEAQIQVYRPHQNIKPKVNKYIESDELFRSSVKKLERRIESLEKSIDSIPLHLKNEREIESLGKRINFLQRKVDESEEFEWIKKPDFY